VSWVYLNFRNLFQKTARVSVRREYSASHNQEDLVVLEK
jgi:hypothetical protein